MTDALDSRQIAAKRTEQAPVREDAQSFLEQYLSPEVLAVFPEWQGFLLMYPEPAVSVWIVRMPQDRKRLHRATGTPALLLDEVLAQRGRPPADAWRTLFSCLIVSDGTEEKGGQE